MMNTVVVAFSTTFLSNCVARRSHSVTKGFVSIATSRYLSIQNTCELLDLPVLFS